MTTDPLASLKLALRSIEKEAGSIVDATRLDPVAVRKAAESMRRAAHDALATLPSSDAPYASASAAYKEGMEHMACHRLDDAERPLREAVRMDAKKPEHLVALARLLLANPRYERKGTLPVVMSLLDRCKDVAPRFAEGNALRAEIAREMAG